MKKQCKGNQAQAEQQDYSLRDIRPCHAAHASHGLVDKHYRGQQENSNIEAHLLTTDHLGKQSLRAAFLGNRNRPAKMADTQQVLNVEKDQSAGPPTRCQAISRRRLRCAERSDWVRAQMTSSPDSTWFVPATEGRG